MKRLFRYAFIAGLILLPSLSVANASSTAEAPVDKAVSRVTGSKVYIAVTGLNVPIARWDGFSGMMAIDAGLEIPDDAERKRAEDLLPRVRDSLRQSIHVYMNSSYPADSVPDLDAICQRMQRAIDRALGPNIATVTVASAIIHPYS